MSSTERVFIVTCNEWRTTREYLLAAMSGLDVEQYRTEARRVGIALLTALDWRDIWTRGDNAHPTREEAEAWAREHFRVPTRVLQVTPDDVRAVLREIVSDTPQA